MIRVAAIQIAPVFLDAQKTWEKLKGWIRQAKSENADLVVWGETLIPGYPIWVNLPNAASFNNTQQKIAYSKYWQEAIRLEDSPIVEDMMKLAKELEIMLMGGIVEKYGGSVYCCLITIDQNGKLLGRHRKIKPTYNERLVWADGDRIGLKTHPIKGIRVGGLNCWENWLPLARAALHLQEEIIHIAVWPGSSRLTKDITRFIALEGRSWVFSVSGMIRREDFAHLTEDEFPMKKDLESGPKIWQNGGSVVVDPTGKIVAGPLVDEEGILYVDVDPLLAIRERHNLDISGHYSRFDILNRP
jgi:nitrilase